MSKFFDPTGAIGIRRAALRFAVDLMASSASEALDDSSTIDELVDTTIGVARRFEAWIALGVGVRSELAARLAGDQS